MRLDLVSTRHTPSFLLVLILIFDEYPYFCNYQSVPFVVPVVTRWRLHLRITVDLVQIGVLSTYGTGGAGFS